MRKNPWFMILAAFGAVMISLVALGGSEKLEAATSLNGHVSVQKVMHAATSGVVVDQRTDVSSLQPVTVWNTKISSAIASTDEINPFGKATTNLQARPSFGTDTLPPALGLQRPNKAGGEKVYPNFVIVNYGQPYLDMGVWWQNKCLKSYYGQPGCLQQWRERYWMAK